MSILNEYYEREDSLQASKHLLIEKGILKRKDIRDKIFYSWIRCKNMKVQGVVTADNSRQLRVDPYIKLINEFESDYSRVILTDEAGNYIYDTKDRVGQKYNEQTIFTHGLSLSIVHQESCYVIGHEHLMEDFSNMFSFAGLIQEKENKFMISVMGNIDNTLDQKYNNFLEKLKQASALIKDDNTFIPRTLKEIEKEAILDTLKYTNQNMNEAARILNIGRSTLYRKIKEFD